MDAITSAGGACVGDNKAALDAANECKWFGDYDYAAELVSWDNPFDGWVSNPTTRAVLLDHTYKDIGVARRSANGATYWVVILGTS
ncbi:hypothetical protein CBR_g38431 [Chara braunii]|uniref:SCP domain-containing protein n=1 Tax=Chara braunii TaxID=69332 RepID=A0A388JNQ3_CHABU|nr:hypothetical protein CBR_g38431 [Chara braunii]|eukprot:GBG59405.1 hypothetical protein CBR_g38431 [Chara braunii]